MYLYYTYKGGKYVGNMDSLRCEGPTYGFRVTYTPFSPQWFYGSPIPYIGISSETALLQGKH